jgi:uncharacterized protein (TIGR03067 family)
MKVQGIMLVAVGLLLGADSPPEKAPRREAGHLQGRWELVYSESLVDGKRVRDRESWTAHFSGELLYLEWDEDEEDEFSFRLDPTTDPKSIDLTGTPDDETEPITLRGIYALKGNRLTICLNLKAGKARPAKFIPGCVPGGDTEVWVFRRMKTSFRPLTARWGRGCASLRPLWGGHRGDILCLTFSPDGKTLASAGEDQTVNLHDLAQRKKPVTLKGHTDVITSIAFSPDGKLLASASEDHTVKLWEVASGKARATLRGHTAAVRCVRFSPDGKTLASAGLNGRVRLWDVAALKQKAALKHSEAATAVAFSPDGKTVASAGLDQTVRLWDAATCRQQATLRVHSAVTWSLAFSPDGRILAAGCQGSIKLWDVAARRDLASLKGHGDFVFSLAFTPDGKTLASASYDGTVKLWDLAKPGEETTLPSRHVFGLHAVAFSPDGKCLGAGGLGRGIDLWEMHQQD